MPSSSAEPTSKTASPLMRDVAKTKWYMKERFKQGLCMSCPPGRGCKNAAVPGRAYCMPCLEQMYGSTLDETINGP